MYVCNFFVTCGVVLFNVWWQASATESPDSKRSQILLITRNQSQEKGERQLRELSLCLLTPKLQIFYVSYSVPSPGDQIIAINGVSLVGLPLSTCQTYIKNSKNQTVVKLTVVPCAPVVEVKIKRPDTKYQLGFSVQNGVVSSQFVILLRWSFSHFQHKSLSRGGLMLCPMIS